VADDPHGIVSRSSARLSGRQDTRASSPGRTIEFRSDDKPISRAGYASSPLSAADAAATRLATRSAERLQMNKQRDRGRNDARDRALRASATSRRAWILSEERRRDSERNGAKPGDFVNLKIAPGSDLNPENVTGGNPGRDSVIPRTRSLRSARWVNFLASILSDDNEWRKDARHAT